MLSKDQTAQRLVDAHFGLDEGVLRIFRMVEVDESDVGKPIKLLEINDMTPESGILPIAMTADPSHEVYYASVVVEITPHEFERLVAGKLSLPNGWTLGAELFPARRAAETAS